MVFRLSERIANGTQNVYDMPSHFISVCNGGKGVRGQRTIDTLQFARIPAESGEFSTG